MSLLVMKFGGTSVGNATAIAALAEITREQLVVWDRAVVVVSAMSGVTDLLIQGAQTAATGDAEMYKAIAIRLREKHAAALAELVSAHPDLGAAGVALLEPGVAARRRTTPGGAGPGPVADQLRRIRVRLDDDAQRLGA